MSSKIRQPVLRNRGLVFAATLITFVFAAVALGFSIYFQVESDLHISLDDAKTHMRPGFDAAELLYPDLNDSDWVHSDGICSLADAGLLKEYKQPLLTMTDASPMGFTYVIEFEASSHQIVYLRQHASVPALFLTAVGDNWALYLNGNLIQSDMNLDEQGEIINHRWQRRVVIPFDSTNLKEGTNHLVLKIVGPPNYQNLGLVSFGGNYIDEFEIVQQNSDNFAMAIIIGICIFMFLDNFLIFLRSTEEKRSLSFAILALLMAIHTATKAPVAYHLFEDVLVIKKIKYMSLIGITIPLTFFLSSVVEGKVRAMQWVLVVISCALVALIPFGGMQFVHDAFKIGHLTLVANLIYCTLGMLVFVFYRIDKYRRQNHVSFRTAGRNAALGSLVTDVLIGTSIACGGITWNRITNGDRIENIGVWLFSIVLSMTFALNDDHIKAKMIVAKKNEYLEEAIRQRTRELAEQVKVANAANKSKSQFLATMSHEIRTPLNAILGIADIEMMNEDLPTSTQESLAKLQASAYSLLGLINDILDLSKIEMGKVEILPAQYDMLSLINDTVQMNVIRIEDKDIQFQLEVSPELPNHLRGDELRIKQVFNNVLSNAFKYTDQGTVKMKIFCEELDKSKNLIYLVCSIADTGQGMKPEDVSSLFVEYTRFNSRENINTEGTGLGMSITKNLVSLMGGTIDVESEYGVGSTFTIRLRQEVVSDKVIGEERADELQTFNFAEARKVNRKAVNYIKMPYARVLIVDDVDTNLFVAKGLMMPYKLQIETISSGEEALKRVSDGETYDIIFMDQMMPGMDGIEATQKIRNLGYDGIIVALTANALSGNAERLMALGFHEFLSKPIDIEKLDAVLKRFISATPPEGFVMEENEGIVLDDDEAMLRQELLTVFRRDARKAEAVMSESFAEKDYKQFTIFAHAMKSALANVGEEGLSKRALALEQAGNEENEEYISVNLEAFLKQLVLVGAEDVQGESDETVVDSNIPLLQSKLSEIRAAAAEYDADAAESAMRELNLEKWSHETQEILDCVSEMLLHSDFDEIVALLEKE